MTYTITLSLGKSKGKRHAEVIQLMSGLPRYEVQDGVSYNYLTPNDILENWPAFNTIFEIASDWVAFDVKSHSDLVPDRQRKHALYIALFHLKQTMDKVPKPPKPPAEPPPPLELGDRYIKGNGMSIRVSITLPEKETNPYPVGSDAWSNWEIDNWKKNKRG